MSFHKPNWLTYGGFIALLTAFLFVFIVAVLVAYTIPRVDVLRCPDNRKCIGDYYVHVDDRVYRAGDTLILNIEWVKEKSTVGIATRTIECKNKAGLYSMSYAIGSARGDASMGKGGRDIVLVVPTIPNAIFPSRCRVTTVTAYQINKIRSAIRGDHLEYGFSNDFTLDKSDVVVDKSTDSDDDNQVVENAPPDTSNQHANQMSIPNADPAPVIIQPEPEDSQVDPPSSYLQCIGSKSNVLPFLRGIIGCL